MPSGLHILIAIKRSREAFVAYSILDHGTLRKTIQMEAEGSDISKITNHVLALCHRYDEAGDGVPPNQTAQYTYIDMSGKMKGPVSRDWLFRLVDSGDMNWDSQVWNSSVSGAGWESLNQAIGFSQIQ